MCFLRTRTEVIAQHVAQRSFDLRAYAIYTFLLEFNPRKTSDPANIVTKWKPRGPQCCPPHTVLKMDLEINSSHFL